MSAGRLWFYTNYHCNLACRYCLTESRPDAPRRTLDADAIVAAAGEAVTLGFTAFGVTGGEPFLRPDMPSLLAHLGSLLPTVVLTNGTLFTERLLDALRPLASLPVGLRYPSIAPSPTSTTRSAQRATSQKSSPRSLVAARSD